MKNKCQAVLAGSLMLLMAVTASAATVRVAVAANFTATMRSLASAFETNTGHRVLLSFGSTGTLYAQIINGAPFDVFLSADQRRPQLLERSGAAVTGSRFTYAMGRLALWSAQPGLVTTGGAVLNTTKFKHIAIANPKNAPYGAAAVDVLNTLGLYQQLRPRIVQGENIAQTYQFVATGNAALGFVALSQVKTNGGGSWWRIPQKDYAPIRQDAVLLKHGIDNHAAKQLLKFLRSPAAKRIIVKNGYGVQ